MLKSKNKIFLASTCALALCGIGLGVTLGTSGVDKAVLGEVGGCENGDHIGNEYEGVKPTFSKPGFQACRVCCQCHTVILEKDYTEKGTWTKMGEEPETAVEETPPAYIAPVISADELSEVMNALGTSVSMDHVTDIADYRNALIAQSYLTDYQEAGGDVSLVSGLENLEGIKNSLSLVQYSLFDQAFTRYGITFERGYTDEGINFLYTKATISDILSPSGLPQYRDFAPFSKSAFEGVTGDVEFMIRSDVEAEFLVQAGTKTTSSVKTKANEWVTVTIPKEMVTIIQEGDDTVESYLKNNVALPVGFSLDISCFFTRNLDLTEYNVLSNEGYNTPVSLFSCNYAANRILASGNPWFKGTQTPDNKANWTNNFVEVTVSNKTGSEIDNSVEHDWYDGIYFNAKGKAFENVDEIFLMVYSNEEVGLKYARVGDVVRKGQENASYDIEQTRLYKGWNRIDIKKDAVNGMSFGSHFMEVVPETFSTTLEMTTTALFYSTQSAE